MIIDVDYFKLYNDNYGHQQGDIVLQQISAVFKDTLRRTSDFAFRIGGEEFAVIVSVDDTAQAFTIAENLRKGVEDLKLEHEQNQAADCVTVSIGLKTYESGEDKALESNSIYRLADEALYEAKEKGRNQVAVHRQVVDIQKISSASKL